MASGEWASMRMMGGALAGAALVAAGAAAQEQRTLAGGFTPDPAVVAFAAQGTDPTGGFVRGCPGYAPAGPAVILRLDGANAPLRVFARGQGLAAIMTVGPDGVYRCGPADASGVAFVRYDRPLSGDYALWAATAVPGATATGEFLLSEVDIELEQVPGMQEGGAAAAEAAFDATAEPAWGRLELPPQGPILVSLTTTPRASLSGLDQSCSGAADPARPDVVVTLPAGEPELHLIADSDLDATLAVVAPDGTVTCIDDSLGTNPVVSLYDAAPGAYAVWVGAWNDAEGPATLTVDRSAPAGAGGGGTPLVALSPDAAPAWGAYTLPQDGAVAVGLTLSGGQAASGVDPNCFGDIDPSRPDLVVSLGADENVVHVAATSAVDTTLVVLDPSGALHCNDDFGGINPGVTLWGAAAGDYAIWVGVWAGAEGSAEVTVSREAPEDGAAAMENPFEGVALTSAVQAFDILMASGGAEAIAYGRIEETGPEGFVLHDVTLTDPEDPAQTLRVARIAVSDLDLAGLSATGASDRFALRIDGVDYAALAAASQGQDGPPLPFLDPAPPLALAFSLLPPAGDAGRRDIDLLVDLEGHMALRGAATVLWDPSVAADGMPDPEGMVAERLEVELRDLGFVGAVMTTLAEQQGRPRDQMIADLKGMLGLMLPPGPPGSPVESLRGALLAKLDAIDARGVLNLRLAPSGPTPLGGLVEALAADPSGAAALGEVSITYTPLP